MFAVGERPNGSTTSRTFLSDAVFVVWRPQSLGVSINSNTGALRTLRALSGVSSALATTRTRLASGARINSAADDAAGLAVADKLRTSSRLHTQAIRNLNDGISALSIAGSTLDQQSAITTRLKELAEQAANGTFSAQQRDSLSLEYDSLVREFGRLGDSATFNGLDLLRGSRGNTARSNFQAGIDGGGGSNISISGIDTGTLSGIVNLSFDVADSDGNAGPDGIVDNGDFVYYSSTVGSNKLTFEQMAAFASESPIKIEAIDDSGIQRDLYVLLTGFDGFGDDGTIMIYTQALGSDKFDPVLAPVPFAIGPDNRVDWATIFAGNPLQGFSNTTLDLSGLEVYIASSFSGSPSENLQPPTLLEQTGLETQERALLALDILENRLNQLGRFRGELGASQSRLESALKVAAASAENTAAAESRIRDADIAAEAAQSVRLEILQQSAVQVLRSVSTQPTLALQLLSI